MAAPVDCFDVWLRDKLLSLDSDDSVFTDYIKGILSGDDTLEEKSEALEGILSGITESDIEELCKEIFQKWSLCCPSKLTNGNHETPKVDFEVQMSKLMEEQNKMATVADRPRTSVTDQKLKEAILQQYSEISDHEEDADDAHPDEGEPAKNANREEVAKEEQERRERLKAEAAAKRERDKLDREKQKQQQTERKDKEKKRTAKSEKKR